MRSHLHDEHQHRDESWDGHFHLHTNSGLHAREAGAGDGGRGIGREGKEERDKRWKAGGISAYIRIPRISKVFKTIRIEICANVNPNL